MNEKTETPETIAAIVAEMREYDNTPPPKRAWLGLADRIEAAAEREREAVRDTMDAMDCAAMAVRPFVGVDLAKGKPTYTCVKIAPGNAAAMRAALEAARREARDSYDGGEYLGEGADPGFLRILAIIDAALAAPPRNCDVGTAEEQRRRFDEFCEGRLCAECPFTDAGGDCPIEWANAPAQEGGGHA